MTVVQLAHGSVRGAANADGSVLSFRAIPYAEPPVGSRRFAPATAHSGWEGVRDGTVRGPVAPQVYDSFERQNGQAELPNSEVEALHLTVHTPSLDGRRPVFVWIHGGSFTSGSSAWDMYDTEHFARDGVVSVGFNYRLGAFGFVDLRSHFAESTEANLALTDAVEALRWIRDNIAAFGGDPERVTIAGESAGAGMVSALLASPLADGLFHRAIPQSGMNFTLQEPDAAARIAANFLRLVDVEPGDRQALEALTSAQILAASENRAALLAGVPELYLSWNLHRDEHSLPSSAFERFAAGELAHIDLLIGTTADENKLRWYDAEPTGVPDETGIESRLLDRLRRVYRAEERAKTDWEIDEAIGNDQSYLVPSMWAAEEHARRGGRTFMYLFTWRSPVLGGRLGSCHALENAFVFDRLETPAFHGDAPPQALADAIHGAWVAFAETGDPNTPALPEWPRYDPRAPKVMELGERPEVLDDPRGRERRAWSQVPPSYFGVG